MTDHPAELPSKYVTIGVGYGSSVNGHLYHIDEWHGPDFHKDRQEAEDAALKVITDDPRAIVALLKVETLYAADIQIKVAVKAS